MFQNDCELSSIQSRHYILVAIVLVSTLTNVNECHSQNTKPEYIFAHVIDNIILQYSEIATYLCILYVSKLTFEVHIDYILNEAHTNGGLVRRTVQAFTKSKTFLRFYQQDFKMSLLFGIRTLN